MGDWTDAADRLKDQREKGKSTADLERAAQKELDKLLDRK